MPGESVPAVFSRPQLFNSLWNYADLLIMQDGAATQSTTIHG